MSDSSQPKNLYQGFEAKAVEDFLKDCVIDLGGTGVNMSDVSIDYSGQNYTYISNGTTITLTQGITGATGAVGAGTYTISNPISSDTITISGIDSYSAFNIPVEWVDCLPPFSRIQDMCEKYPGLKIAFENFKVIYEMVKDDYDNPVPKK